MTRRPWRRVNEEAMVRRRRKGLLEGGQSLQPPENGPGVVPRAETAPDLQPPMWEG